MDDIQNFDTLTVFRLHGHLEEIARRVFFSFLSYYLYIITFKYDNF